MDQTECFLDLAKTFDTVNHKVLLDKLYANGVREKRNKLLTYYKNRKQESRNYLLTKITEKPTQII